ncbi:unnamed protein product [Zymoseptoria tritici ST99CH_1A5]|nr:unnamed protein product [Zymoseptoria tritici ST99CH_1E4]SMR43788.1 unnamed protein product [Zymoseptoria tritici ST99CH_3D1]SMY18948.1 unnamed protein product [Zymoseptoria tritici ST99CH_1A5]
MNNEQYQPPAGPPPSYRQAQSGSPDRPQEESSSSSRTSWSSSVPPARAGLGSNNPYRDGPSTTTQARPPSTALSPTIGGRSPSGQSTATSSTTDVTMDDDEYAPPPGPPPSRVPQYQQYAPPPGPPPSHTTNNSHPSSLREEPSPPPYDPWLGPDDSLRPPPSFAAVQPASTKSPTGNATFDDAARAHLWSRYNPLFQPATHSPQAIHRILSSDLRLTVPPNTTEVTQYQPAIGRTYIRTTPFLTDTILLSDLPVYSPNAQSPLMTATPHTIYFEVAVKHIGDRYNPANKTESGLGIGFVAPPYPAWRLPGWNRGSLGIHSDDGRRYVDNSYGGVPFVNAFAAGDIVGVGMTFAPPKHGDRAGMRAEVFFTRNGTREGGWDLYEERDQAAEEGNVEGLEGEHDLLAAVGVFGSVEFECVFRREEWMYKP